MAPVPAPPGSAASPATGARAPDAVDRLIERFGIEAVVAALGPLLSDERTRRIESVLAARLGSLTVVLENLYDPHNGAAAVRSIEGLGLSALHVVEAAGAFRAELRGAGERAADASGKGQGHRVSDSTVTIGCGKWIDLHRHPDVGAAAAALRAAGMTLCAAVPDPGAVSVDQLPADRPLALWFGNERDGLTAEAQAACDLRVVIPMFGMTRSFNLSVSVALMTARVAERRRAALGRAGDLTDEDRAKRRARWYALSIRGAAEVVERYVSNQTRSDRGQSDPPVS